MKSLKTFKEYFDGLKKSEQTFLNYCKEKEEVNLEEAFEEDGELLFNQLKDEFVGDLDSETYVEYLENLMDNEKK